MYLASKNGTTFRVSGVQVAAFKNAGYTVTEEADDSAGKKSATKTAARKTSAKATAKKAEP